MIANVMSVEPCDYLAAYQLTACYFSDSKRFTINMTSFLNGPKNFDRIDL